ncbi:MAG: 2-polyprenyl-3-methyl-5-hydroxy-6-metoxy-1,4-benzoquinol methylase [Candidatus Marinamargulisbacteria bacterium]|jgi:2-polyprenyl-3-methyl-5-hydroxy-6-metoxy-1,4-benzoquinol methylase
MQNIDLKDRYNEVFKTGAENFFSFSSFPEGRVITEMIDNWKGLSVLDIGCGEGELAAMLQFAGVANVDGIDFSQEAITNAKNNYSLKNVSFECMDFRKSTKTYDVVTMLGVLEHFDKPFDGLRTILKNNVKPGGSIVTSSPSFLNPRGYIWMTLQLLFDVPMSLTDLHFLCPFDFEAFCKKESLCLEIKSANQDMGSGKAGVYDLKKRLTNALKDANFDNSKVDKLLAWLDQAGPYFHKDENTGASVVYKITKP